MSRPVISVEGLSKSYRLGLRSQGGQSFRELLTDVARAPVRWARGAGERAPKAEEFWALKDVSFTVRPGEVIGIIGRNGAGKSTLLKVLSRITEPTEGLVRLRGRVASLLEVGTGFHPELTGRENIYLNGSILGMRRGEIDRNFDQIVAFAEVERFLDTPVKHYSSGMYVRLAFAVAAHLDPQILIVDEVLAVGDAEFQKKCLGRIKEVTNEGRTVLFVSHNAPAVQNLCTRCLFMQRGRLVMEGEPAAMLEAYSRSAGGDTSLDVDLTGHPGRASSARPVLRRVRVRGSGPSGQYIRMGDDVEVEVTFQSEEAMNDPAMWVVVKNHLGMNLFGADSAVNRVRRNAGRGDSGTFTCRFPNIPLTPGVYKIDLQFGSPHRMELDVVHHACQFEIHPADVFGTGKLPLSAFGNVCWPATWEIALGRPTVGDADGAPPDGSPAQAGDFERSLHPPRNPEDDAAGSVGLVAGRGRL